MYAAAALVTVVILCTMYLSENRIISIWFVAVTSAFIVSMWGRISSRKEIWDYLVQHSYDMIPSYSRIEYYDKAIGIYCGFAVLLAAAAIVTAFFRNGFADRIYDIALLISMIMIGLTAVILIIFTSNAYYDSAQIYMPPAEKGLLILLLSFTVRKTIGIL